MGALYVAAGNLDAVGVKQSIAVFNHLAEIDEDLIIDMAAVERLDSSGLGALVFLYKRLRSQGHTVSVINVAGQPLSLLNSLGIARALIGKPGTHSERTVHPVPAVETFVLAEATALTQEHVS